MVSIKKFQLLQKEIAQFDSARLIIVTKKRNIDEILPYILAGQNVFAENIVQEAAKKWPDIFSNHTVELHMIGNLQRNKTKIALDLFDVIQTLDSVKLAQHIDRCLKRNSKTREFYLQVNIGKEPQKHGIFPEKVQDIYTEIIESTKLNITGLMAIPPINNDPTKYFLEMQLLQTKLGLKNLSIGMSNDYKSALKAGATEIRIGSMLFE